MIDAPQELRVALRRLRKNAGTSVLVVITLGSVLGANTLAFSFVNEILLNPLPAVSNKTGLVNVHRWQNDKDGVQGFSYPAFSALAQADVFEKGLVGFNGRGLSLERTSSPELVFGMLVSENYFDALGVRPARGRAFGLADNRKGSAGVVVLSDALWRTRFGGDPGILGSEVRLNGQSFTVIGVGPARFSGHFVGFAADLWIPLSWGPVMSGQSDLMENPATEWLEAFGRLRTGSSDAAAAVLTRIQATLPRVEGGEHAPERVLVEPLTGIDRDLRGPVAAFLVLLQAATILVAVIALLNVSTLLLARSIARGQETAVRLALGASRGNLLAPFALESMVLCGLGGLLGLSLSVLGARVAPGWLPPFAIPIRFDLALDGRTFAFSTLIAVLGTAMATLGPGLAAVRSEPLAALREGGPQRTARSRWRAGLVVAQVAFATAVLVSGSVFARFLVRSAGETPGFDIDRVQITRLDTSVLGKDAESGRSLQARAVEAVASLPGVERVSFARLSPYGIGTSMLQARRSSAGPGDPWFKADWNAVSPGFFETLGGLGLALAAIGLFGLAAQTVASRVREVAIRMAMGATSAEILSMILREGGKLSLGGVSLGLLGAMAATPLSATLVPGISAADPLAFAGASAFVVAVTMVAMVGPAWRASRIAPGLALRAN